MLKNALLTSWGLLLAIGALAQASVSGTVYFGDDSNGPVPGWPVEFYLGTDILVASGETNDDGSFFLSTDATIAGSDLWWVQTIDICTGDVVQASFTPVPGQLDYEQDVYICSGINPPPPPDTCQAFFSFEQYFTDESPLGISFFNLSFGPEGGEEDRTVWDFGDGTTSEEENPTHIYAEPGAYSVTLSINADSCESAITQLVVVVDIDACGCETDEIVPVCVYTPSGQRIVFDNECLAQCAGFDPGSYVFCEEDCFCPTIYSPVCVIGANGDTLTFSNPCYAECEGFGPDQYVDCSDRCECPEIYSPVCVATPGLGQILVFDNACEAECAGFGPNVYYPCDGGCICPEFYAPVCVLTAAGDTLTFDNYCYAECEGFGPDQWFECDPDPCVCPDVYDPVCVVRPEFDFVLTFNNACEAECAGFAPGDYQPCDGCACPEFYDPVCVTLPGTDSIIVFPNYCFAQCEGFGPDQWRHCEEECHCPEDIYDPVCVIGPDGVSIEFINPCEAECAGYGPDQWMPCEPQNCGLVLEVSPTDDPYTFAFSVYGDTDEPLDSVIWDFGDGAISTDQNTTHTYSDTIGFYIVTVTAVDASGCIATLHEFIFLGPECHALIIALPTEENPLGIAFGAIATGDVVSWFWEFGDGNTSEEGSPVHIYEAPGLYDVSLTITTATGCTYTTIKPVSVNEDPCICPDVWDPVCVAGVAGNITFGNACEAECAGFGPEDFVECEEDCFCPDIWDPVCVAGFAGVITFPNACEAICEGFSEEDFLEDCEGDCICDEVYDPVCVLLDDIFLTFSNPCRARCAGFTDDQFVACNPDCACPEIWAPVCVSDTTGVEIMFPNACEAECAGYTSDQLVECSNNCACDDYYLPVCVITANGEIIEFPNPCTALCEGFGPDQIIDCFVSDDCLADFAFEFSADDDLMVQFRDLSYLVDGINSWLWDFGDGSTSMEQNPIHTYATAGLYDVTLTVNSDSCGTVMAAQHICVGEGGGVGGPDCQAFFFLEQPNPDDLLTFQFIDQSVGEVSAWIWDFGDGTTSTETNPIHTYEADGQYVVTLTTLGENCESTIVMNVMAGENIWHGELTCRAWFLPIIEADSLSAFFINLSSPDAIEFLWDFGDGTTSENPLAYHVYAEAGTYEVSLTITTVDGCTSTFTATLDIVEGSFDAVPPFAIVNDTDEAGLFVEDFTAFPNPSTGDFTIRWDATTTGAYQWQVYELSGKLIEQGQGQQSDAPQNLRLDLNERPDGLYLFRLQSPTGVQTLRLSKF